MVDALSEEKRFTTVGMPVDKMDRFDRLANHYGWTRAQTMERIFDYFEHVEAAIEDAQDPDLFGDIFEAYSHILSAAVLVPRVQLDADVPKVGEHPLPNRFVESQVLSAPVKAKAKRKPAAKAKAAKKGGKR